MALARQCTMHCSKRAVEEKKEDPHPGNAYLASHVIWANPLHNITHESQRTKTEMSEGKVCICVSWELSMLRILGQTTIRLPFMIKRAKSVVVFIVFLVQ